MDVRPAAFAVRWREAGRDGGSGRAAVFDVGSRLVGPLGLPRTGRGRGAQAGALSKALASLAHAPTTGIRTIPSPSAVALWMENSEANKTFKLAKTAFGRRG